MGYAQSTSPTSNHFSNVTVGSQVASKHLCKGGSSAKRECIHCRAKLIVSIADVKVRRQMIEGSGLDINELKIEVKKSWGK